MIEPPTIVLRMDPDEFEFEISVPVVTAIRPAGSSPDPNSWRTELNQPLVG
jgi:hypothetical protein